MSASERLALSARALLFYSDAATFGGHEMMSVKAAAALSRSGFDVTFAMFEGNHRLLAAIEHANGAGAVIRPVSTKLGPLRLHALQAPFRWGRLWSIRRMLREVRPDALILVQGRIEAAATAALCAWLGRWRAIAYLPMAHSLQSMAVPQWPVLRDAVNGLYFKAIHRFAVISEGVAADVRKFHLGARCTVVENVVEPAPNPPLDMQASRRSLGLPTDVALIGMIGRVSFEQKGHDCLLQALATSPGLRDAHLVVAGDGPDLHALKLLARRLGVDNRLVCLGWKMSEMNAVYASIDVLALPSHYEGVPLVMLEALVRRIPVIGANADGMAEWLPAAARFDPVSPEDIGRAFRHATESGDAIFAAAFEKATGRTDVVTYAADWRRAILALGDDAFGEEHG